LSVASTTRNATTGRKTGKEYKYYIPNGEEIAREILGETKGAGSRI